MLTRPKSSIDIGEQNLHAVYQPLAQPSKHIRLLKILHLSPEITCELIEVSLQSDPTYVALSYTWGDPNSTRIITINGVLMSITTNLAHALEDIHHYWLQHMTQGAQRPLIWADAISINQKDIYEKNHQIPLMKDIYSNAEVVLSFIGRSDQISQAFDGFSLMDQEVNMLPAGKMCDTSWMMKYPALCMPRTLGEMESGFHTMFDAMMEMMILPYWGRVWIIQEIVLARRVLFLSRGRTLPLRKIIQVYKYLQALGKQCDYRHCPDYIDQPSWALVTGTLPSVMEPILRILGVKEARESQDSSGTEGAGTVMNTAPFNYKWDVMKWSSAYFATDPRDHVYGLLGLIEHDIKIDYSDTNTAAHVYCDFVERWLRDYPDETLIPEGESYPELWFLGQAGAGYHIEAVVGLPTWVPDFANSSKVAEGESIWMNPDACNADRDLTIAEMQRAKYVRISSLHCAVIKVSMILGVGPRIALFHDSNRAPWLSLRSWIMRCVSEIPFYGPCGVPTLFAIQQALYQTSPTYGQWNAEEVVPLLCALLGIRDDVNDVVNVMSGRLAFDPWRNNGEEVVFLERVAESFSMAADNLYGRLLQHITSTQRVIADLQMLAVVATKIRGARLALTCDGYLGLFPPKVGETDVVSVVRGCPSPIILRRVDNHYIHLGCCFIVGLMNGEVAQLLRSGNLLVDQVEIR